MATQESTPFTELIADQTVVDADVHISYEDPAVQRKVSRYMDQPYKSYLDPDGPAYSRPYPTDGRPRTLGGKYEKEVASLTDRESIRTHLCEDHGVDHPILHMPPVLNRVQDINRVLMEMRAMNDVLLNDFLDEDDDFFGLPTIYAKKPEAAAEEIDRIADESQVVGLFVQSSGVETPLGDPKYDVMYRAAEDSGLPIVFHGTADIAHAIDMPIIPYGLRTSIEADSVGHEWAQLLTLTSLAIQGVPVKFPDLEFAFLESGTAWQRWLMARVSREYGQRPSEAPLLEKSPEAYLEEISYFGLHPLEQLDNSAHQDQLLRTLDDESLLFASNFPQSNFDAPATVYERVSDFSEETRDRIFAGNATRLFDLQI